MIWTITGAALVLYESWALARRRVKVSDLAHKWPWCLVILGWWGGLGLHFWREWRRDERSRRAA